MVHDLPVRGDNDPLFPVFHYHSFDHRVCLVTEARVDNTDTSGNCLLLVMASCFPAVKYDGDVMAFQFFVRNKQLNKPLPLFLEVPVLYADEIVPINDDRGNRLASNDTLWCYYSIALPCRTFHDT